MDYNRDYFKDKMAVVTGGASGIGLALAEELLKSNAAKVVIADINRDNLVKEEERLKAAYGDRIKGILCDVTKEEEVKELVKLSLVYMENRIDLLFNNAGVGFAGWFNELDNEDWEKAFNLNFFSALYGMRAVLPVMVAQGGGQIVNTISGIAFYPMAMQSRYTATKAALNSLTLALRYEYWDDNIKISSATPGTTATAIWGDNPIPAIAQTAEQSATRILNGVVNNDRLIFGDDSDAGGAVNCFDEAHKEDVDQYLLNVARQRRKGVLAI